MESKLAGQDWKVYFRSSRGLLVTIPSKIYFEAEIFERTSIRCLISRTSIRRIIFFIFLFLQEVSLRIMAMASEVLGLPHQPLTPKTLRCANQNVPPEVAGELGRAFT